MIEATYLRTTKLQPINEVMNDLMLFSSIQALNMMYDIMSEYW